MQDRLLIFLHPESDFYGQGYNILQARISIGAGGLFGKGFLAGTQSQLHFLKVQYADFIFSVVAEEFGLIGALAMVALLYVIVFRYLYVAMHAPDAYGALIAVGFAAWLGLHIFRQCRHEPQPDAGGRHPAAVHQLRRILDVQPAGGAGSGAKYRRAVTEIDIRMIRSGRRHR